jgi:hypothetical protein
VTYVPIYALLMAWSFMFNCASVFLLATFVIFHDLLHFLDINLQYFFYGKELSMERYLVCNLNIKYYKKNQNELNIGEGSYKIDTWCVI